MFSLNCNHSFNEVYNSIFMVEKENVHQLKRCLSKDSKMFLFVDDISFLEYDKEIVCHYQIIISL